MTVRAVCLHLELQEHPFASAWGFVVRAIPACSGSSPKICVAAGTLGLGDLWVCFFFPCEDLGSSTSWEQRMVRVGEGMGHCWRQELCGDKLRDNFLWAQGSSSSAGEPGPCACSFQGHMPKSPRKRSIFFSIFYGALGSISHFSPCATRTFLVVQSGCLAVAKPHHSIPEVPCPAS